ncbi:Ca-activated chloride channel family protein [Winogradskyella epiphytica]|uniref:Ca-activated chloride channel family protein n=1 Tax=Winogradskyella epiphytica TaxID=262005 RepID=A0A2V4WWF7_9FLAO|nr:VWA domain-containing protein [Winogradskyella epiphytica]PYE81566.1 Ca-activated chloride channel family protein [Winogradskyella epiphytica]GGW64220.1 VWA domain-containing protein [Winogradskyella epiphytica]
MKNLVFILCILLSSLSLNAQEKTISGTITSSADGLPLPGASVIVKGTSRGAQTDFDGNYKINVKVGEIIVVSYVGMTSKEVTIGSSLIYNVALEAASQLDEVIVVGYGTYTRRGITGAVSITKPTLGSKLSGRVVGVSHRNGRHRNTIIRGVDSSLSNEPLYILNGKPISEDKFKSIKADKIKDIEILNAQQGSVVFGYQGTKGVVILRTKGRKNKVDLDNLNNFLNESYSKIEENDFKRTNLAALSTFSIDVDKAGYSNIRRMINNGQSVPSDAVKVEEMVNYFNYNYPQPTDEHPFSITTEVVKTPWHNDTQLVRIGLQGKTYNNDELPASNLTFLIDVSGSMGSPNKLPLLKSAFKVLVNQLREKDKVSIVVYAGAAGVVLEPTSGKHKEKILAALDNLNSGGSTAGGAGIELAYKLAEKNFKKNGNNRVILATDGDFNVGASSDSDMQSLIEEKRKSGVFLSVLGFGYGNYKDSKLETLADKGNGNHAYIDTMQEAQKVFGKEFGGTLYTIAKDVKIQVEFNPNKVQAYRLIGYENRLLADEDFIDDTKDAGELGSGHTVTALYEIIPAGVASDYLKKVSNLKYTKTGVKSNYVDELFTVKFRYKKPSEDQSIEMIHVQKDIISEASNDMNFASSVALFGMQLRNSKYFNNASLSKVIELAESGRGEDKDGYRAEFIRLVNSYQTLN